MIKTPLSTVIGGAFWTPGATVINGAKLSFEIVMKKLFANGEQGFWYDPFDMGTMYQDAAGTTPVTAAGQPVGLILDKSRGLSVGGEMWNDSSVSFNGESTRLGVNRYHIKSTGGVFSGFFCTPPVDLRRVLVVVEFTIESISAGQVGTEILGHAGSITLGKNRIIGTSGTSNMQFKRVGVTDAIISNISMKELFGSHSYQTTLAARPILRDTPRRIDFDAVDDKLITNLPAQLTGCTVARSVPNVGTQILTGQTIPATYEDNTDHCGLLVINRVLTPSETSAITAEFDKRAGV